MTFRYHSALSETRKRSSGSLDQQTCTFPIWLVDDISGPDAGRRVIHPWWASDSSI
jgi:hypothetical protein